MLHLEIWEELPAQDVAIPSFGVSDIWLHTLLRAKKTLPSCILHDSLQFNEPSEPVLLAYLFMQMEGLWMSSFTPICQNVGHRPSVSEAPQDVCYQVAWVIGPFPDPLNQNLWEYNLELTIYMSFPAAQIETIHRESSRMPRT